MTYLMGGPRDGASEAGGCYHDDVRRCKAAPATAACLHGDPSLNPAAFGRRRLCDDTGPGRGVAQPGSASHWGCGGRWFESSRPDHHPIMDHAAWSVSDEQRSLDDAIAPPNPFPCRSPPRRLRQQRPGSRAAAHAPSARGPVDDRPDHRRPRLFPAHAAASHARCRRHLAYRPAAGARQRSLCDLPLRLARRQDADRPALPHRRRSARADRACDGPASAVGHHPLFPARGRRLERRRPVRDLSLVRHLRLANADHAGRA